MNVVRGALWAVELTRPAPCWPTGGYRIRESSDSPEELASRMEVRLAEVNERLRRGSAVVAAWSGSRIVGWCWVSTGQEWAPPLGRTLRFAEDEGYGWSAGVVDDHQGNGLFTVMLQAAGRHLAAQGKRVMWGGILDWNVVSQRSADRAGWRPVVRVTARDGSIFWRPVAYADPRLVERARLVLDLGSATA